MACNFSIAFGIGSSKSAKDPAFKTSVGSEDGAACVVLSEASAPTAPSKPASFLSIVVSVALTKIGNIATWSNCKRSGL